MKIYFIGDYMDGVKHDAPLLAAASLFDAFRKADIPVKYITYFCDGSNYSVFQKLFGKQILSSDSMRFGIFPMILFITRTRPDVLYLLNLEFFYLPLLLLKYIFRYKIYYTSHGIAAYENHYFRRLPLILKLKNSITEYLNFKISDNIISLSQKTARLISYCYKLDRTKIRVLNNGVSPSTSLVKKTTVFNPEEIKLVVVGSTSRKEKGIEFLISALTSSNYIFELNIFGEKTDLPRSDRYDNLNVNFNPFVERKELFCKLIENNIFIVPSYYDTFNLSLLEAMNLGMLFIASDRVGLTERFDNRLFKFVYKHKSKSDLLDKLKMIINLSPEEKNYYSDLNHQFSLGFTWDKVSTQYLALFNE